MTPITTTPCGGGCSVPACPCGCKEHEQVTSQQNSGCPCGESCPCGDGCNCGA